MKKFFIVFLTFFNVILMANSISHEELMKKNSNTKYKLGIYSTKTKDYKQALRKYIDIKKNGIEPEKIIKLSGKDLYFSDEINSKIIYSKDGRVHYPKLHNDEYIIVKVISNSNKKNKRKKRLTLVKENHAVVSHNHIKYIMDSYIVLMENPYYVTIEREDKAPITYKKAIEISVEYIKPRGCTSPLKLLPTLDRTNLDKTKWMIGISC